jgi:hypothetical protein
VVTGLLPALADGRVPSLAGHWCRLLRSEDDPAGLVEVV